MSCIHYKFKSSMDYDTLTFDGLHISLADLKKAIIDHKKLGKSGDFHLQITDAQTKQAYVVDSELIPRNASVIVTRVPIGGTSIKSKIVEDALKNAALRVPSFSKSGDKSDAMLSNKSYAANNNQSEEDKINMMMKQSTRDYDPSNYVKPKGPVGKPHAGYTCFRCGKIGHYIQNCPEQKNEPGEIIKRPTRYAGIPKEFLTMVSGDAPGARLTSQGMYAVPTIDKEAFAKGKKEKPPFVPQEESQGLIEEEDKVPVPGELICPICKGLLKDAVVIPCCGTSFCDECVRNALMSSDDHRCPMDGCGETDVSPNSLIPNKFLRTAVVNFLNETGYAQIKKKVKNERENSPSVTTTTHRDSPEPPPPPKELKPPTLKKEHNWPTLPDITIPQDLVGLPPQVVQAKLREREMGDPDYSSPSGYSSPPDRREDRWQHSHTRRRSPDRSLDRAVTPPTPVYDDNPSDDSLDLFPEPPTYIGPDRGDPPKKDPSNSSKSTTNSIPQKIQSTPVVNHSDHSAPPQKQQPPVVPNSSVHPPPQSQGPPPKLPSQPYPQQHMGQAALPPRPGMPLHPPGTQNATLPPPGITRHPPPPLGIRGPVQPQQQQAMMGQQQQPPPRPYGTLPVPPQGINNTQPRMGGPLLPPPQIQQQQPGPGYQQPPPPQQHQGLPGIIPRHPPPNMVPGGPPMQNPPGPGQQIRPIGGPMPPHMLGMQPTPGMPPQVGGYRGPQPGPPGIAPHPLAPPVGGPPPPAAKVLSEEEFYRMQRRLKEQKRPHGARRQVSYEEYRQSMKKEHPPKEKKKDAIDEFISGLEKRDQADKVKKKSDKLPQDNATDTKEGKTNSRSRSGTPLSEKSDSVPKKGTLTPRRKKSRSVSPRLGSRTPLRDRSGSRTPPPRRVMSRSPARRGSPIRRVGSRTPPRKFSRSPARWNSRSPGRKFSRSPRRMSPGRRYSRSPGRWRSISPGRKLSRSPGRRPMKSPGRGSRSPGKWRGSRSPMRRGSRSPFRRMSRSPRGRSPMRRKKNFSRSPSWRRSFSRSPFNNRRRSFSRGPPPVRGGPRRSFSRTPPFRCFSRSPKRGNRRSRSFTPRRRFSRSPGMRKRSFSRSPSRGRRRFSRSPKRKPRFSRSPSPKRRLSRSPHFRRKSFSRSPHRKRSRTPKRRSFSRSPKRTAPLGKKISRRTRSKTPEKKISRSPLRKMSPRRRSKSPYKNIKTIGSLPRSKTPVPKARTPPPKQLTPPPKTRDPSPKPKTPPRELIQSPMKKKSPPPEVKKPTIPPLMKERSRTKSPERKIPTLGHQTQKAPIRKKSKSPNRRNSPTRRKSPLPIAAKARSPSPRRMGKRSRSRSPRRRPASPYSKRRMSPYSNRRMRRSPTSSYRANSPYSGPPPVWPVQAQHQNTGGPPYQQPYPEYYGDHPGGSSYPPPAGYPAPPGSGPGPMMGGPGGGGGGGGYPPSHPHQFGRHPPPPGTEEDYPAGPPRDPYNIPDDRRGLPPAWIKWYQDLQDYSERLNQYAASKDAKVPDTRSRLERLGSMSSEGLSPSPPRRGPVGGRSRSRSPRRKRGRDDKGYYRDGNSGRGRGYNSSRDRRPDRSNRERDAQRKDRDRDRDKERDRDNYYGEKRGNPDKRDRDTREFKDTKEFKENKEKESEKKNLKMEAQRDERINEPKTKETVSKEPTDVVKETVALTAATTTSEGGKEQKVKKKKKDKEGKSKEKHKKEKKEKKKDKKHKKSKHKDQLEKGEQKKVEKQEEEVESKQEVNGDVKEKIREETVVLELSTGEELMGLDEMGSKQREASTKDGVQRGRDEDVDVKSGVKKPERALSEERVMEEGQNDKQEGSLKRVEDREQSVVQKEGSIDKAENESPTTKKAFKNKSIWSSRNPSASTDTTEPTSSPTKPVKNESLTREMVDYKDNLKQDLPEDSTLKAVSSSKATVEISSKPETVDKAADKDARVAKESDNRIVKKDAENIRDNDTTTKSPRESAAAGKSPRESNSAIKSPRDPSAITKSPRKSVVSVASRVDKRSSDEMMVKLPEMSKWEMSSDSEDDEEDLQPPAVSSRREEKAAALPRSVIESAAHHLASKSMRGAILPVAAPPQKANRRVFIDMDKPAAERKVSKKPTSAGVSVTIASAPRLLSVKDRLGKRVDAYEAEQPRGSSHSVKERLGNKMDSHRDQSSSTASTATSSGKRTIKLNRNFSQESRRDAEDSRNDSRDSNRRGDRDYGKREWGGGRRDSDRKYSNDRKDTDRRDYSSNSAKDDMSDKTESKERSKRESDNKRDYRRERTKEIRNSLDGPRKTEESNSSSTSKSGGKSGSTKASKFDRKVSVADESVFEPDYDEDDFDHHGDDTITPANSQDDSDSSDDSRSRSNSPGKARKRRRSSSSGGKKKHKKHKKQKKSKKNKD